MHARGKCFRYTCFCVFSEVIHAWKSFLVVTGDSSIFSDFPAFPGSSTLSSIRTETWFQSAAAKNVQQHPPFLSHAHPHVCAHRVWGTNSLHTTSSLPSPHPLTFVSPPTPTGFQPISPGLLISLTRQQMGSEQRNWVEMNI